MLLVYGVCVFASSLLVYLMSEVFHDVKHPT